MEDVDDLADFDISDGVPMLWMRIAEWIAWGNDDQLPLYVAEFVWPADRVELLDTHTNRPRNRRAARDPS